MAVKNMSQTSNTKRMVIFIVVSILIWEVLGRWIHFLRFLVSTPTEVLDYAVAHQAELVTAFITTGSESVMGLVCAFVFALSAVIAGLYSARLYRWMLPAAVISQVIPLVSLAPFFILAFGLGFTGKVAMATTMCFFPIFVNFSAGIVGVPKPIRDLLFIYSFTRTQSIFRVYLPLSLPSIFAGLRIAATLAVIGAIVAEFNGAESGLGKNLFLAARRLEPELMMASLALSSLLGGSLYLALNQLERKIGKWYVPHHGFGI